MVFISILFITSHRNTTQTNEKWDPANYLGLVGIQGWETIELPQIFLLSLSSATVYSSSLRTSPLSLVVVKLDWLLAWVIFGQCKTVQKLFLPALALRSTLLTVTDVGVSKQFHPVYPKFHHCQRASFVSVSKLLFLLAARENVSEHQGRAKRLSSVQVRSFHPQ